MKPGTICLLLACISAILLSTSCGGSGKPFIPVTGGDEVPVPAAIKAACGNVLEYAGSSSCLKSALPDLDWALDDVQYQGQYRYRSGDWLMVIWPATAGRDDLRVVIMNKKEDAYWCGYVEPGGEVVDTSFMP